MSAKSARPKVDLDATVDRLHRVDLVHAAHSGEPGHLFRCEGGHRFRAV